jgi:hypothetical protein
MTFTYDLVTPTNLTRVRYHIGDTESTTAIFSDEEINFVLAEEAAETSVVGATVVSLINTAIAKLNHEPDMQADWLKVDWRRSAENWLRLLSEKKTKFGLSPRGSSGGQHAWRPDTLQTEAPDYPNLSLTDLLDD